MNDLSASTTEPDTNDLNSPMKLDRFSYDDQIVRMFTLATLVWGIVGTVAGLLVAILLVMPGLTFTQYISFGRLRPLHTNAAILRLQEMRSLPRFIIRRSDFAKHACGATRSASFISGAGNS